MTALELIKRGRIPLGEEGANIKATTSYKAIKEFVNILINQYQTTGVQLDSQTIKPSRIWNQLSAIFIFPK